MIDNAAVDSIGSYEPPDTERRLNLYLGRAISILNGKLTGQIEIADRRLLVASWSQGTDDAIAIAQYLTVKGALIDDLHPTLRRIGVQAHLIYEEARERRAATAQAFVAMWFDASTRELFEHGISKAIEGAGYDPVRVDRVEHDQKIDDRIIAEIRRSAFVVADFTGHRGGVYYEVGFAHGLGKRVIFTCKRDAIDQLHFDVRQYNAILWDAPADVVGPLRNRLLALFGSGPKGSDGPI
ncbi:MAG TPA: hypothetical protein VIJ63_07905 [Roseiarcus sp.]